MIGLDGTAWVGMRQDGTYRASTNNNEVKTVFVRWRSYLQARVHTCTNGGRHNSELDTKSHTCTRHACTRTRTRTRTRTHKYTWSTCAHACTHARLHARTPARTHTCTHARLHARTPARTEGHTHARTHTGTLGRLGSSPFLVYVVVSVDRAIPSDGRSLALVIVDHRLLV